MTDHELKPCPMCGSDHVVIADLAGWEAWCEACGVCGAASDRETGEAWTTREKCAAAWNSRAPIDRLNAEWMAKCEELRKDSERYKWLRDEGDISVRDVFGSWCRELNDGLDAAIDAALAKKEGA